MQMLAVLRNAPDPMNMASLKDQVDPSMMDLYPHDCLFKVHDLPFPSHSICLGWLLEKLIRKSV